MLRFAFSPVRDLTINDMRIALFNYILSKQLNEEMLVRVDDTHKKKNIEGKDKEVLSLLNLFGIEHSRVIIQSENIKYHTGMGMNLLLDRKAFNCFCSKDALSKDKKQAKKEGKLYSYSGFCETISDETKFNCNAPFVVRLKKPEDTIEFDDELNGKSSYKPHEIDSLIILGVDKTPESDFASAVDDMLYDISFLVESNENVLNTARQIHIRKSLDYNKELKYAHIPSIKDDLEIQTLIDEGFLPVAIVNYLISLSIDTPEDIFSVEDAIKWFDIKKIKNKIVKFDKKELKKINKIYLETMDDMRLSKLLGFADEDIGRLAKIYLDKSNTIKELKSNIDKIFSKKPNIKKYKQEHELLVEILKDTSFIDKYEDFIKELKEKSKLSEDVLIEVLSFILLGELHSVKLAEAYPYIKNYLGEII